MNPPARVPLGLISGPLSSLMQYPSRFTNQLPPPQVTHNGLDVMVRRMLSEMRLLTVDEDQDVVYNNSRWGCRREFIGIQYVGLRLGDPVEWD